MSVGTSADLWRHPLASTQTILPTNRKPFIFRLKAIWFAWCGSQKNPLVKSKPFFRETTISNLLLLGVGKIGTTGHLYFRKQKKLERHNWRAASRSSCRLANFFFGTFFFLAKKKVERPLLAKGKNFIKSSVCLPKKFSKNSFYLENLSSGRCPLFYDNTAPYRKKAFFSIRSAVETDGFALCRYLIW